MHNSPKKLHNSPAACSSLPVLLLPPLRKRLVPVEVDQAASHNKKLQLVEGATHIAMYDKCVPQAMAAMVPFLKENL